MKNATRRSTARPSRGPRLLTGGNPQIAMGDGGAPVRAYIAAMPGWKRAAGRHLDALLGRTVPDLTRAVRWNSPFYGVRGGPWFLGVHCMTKYIKVAFFQGTALTPMPPVASASKGVRYLHIEEHKNARVSDAILTRWIRQAADLARRDTSGSSTFPGAPKPRR